MSKDSTETKAIRTAMRKAIAAGQIEKAIDLADALAASERRDMAAGK